MNFSERLFNEYKHRYTRFVIENGHGYYIEDNTLYTIDEFKKKYPIPVKAVDLKTKENIDSTRQWLYS